MLTSWSVSSGKDVLTHGGEQIPKPRLDAIPYAAECRPDVLRNRKKSTGRKARTDSTVGTFLYIPYTVWFVRCLSGWKNRTVSTVRSISRWPWPHESFGNKVGCGRTDGRLHGLRCSWPSMRHGRGCSSASTYLGPRSGEIVDLLAAIVATTIAFRSHRRGSMRQRKGSRASLPFHTTDRSFGFLLREERDLRHRLSWHGIASGPNRCHSRGLRKSKVLRSS